VAKLDCSLPYAANARSSLFSAALRAAYSKMDNGLGMLAPGLMPQAAPSRPRQVAKVDIITETASFRNRRKIVAELQQSARMRR
jgi:hypothetical protein